MNAQERMLKWYQDSLKEFGPSDFRSLTWGNEQGTSAKARYDQMNNLVTFSDKSVIEFGCGWGSFFDFEFTCQDYLGIDISEEFIQLANMKHPDRTFIDADILTDNQYGYFDLAISSGVAGNQGGPADHPTKLRHYLQRMLLHADKVLVNFPSTWATIRTPNIEYFSPSATLEVALAITPSVELYHKERSDFLMLLTR